jgi:two-component system CheB/CheR fusion protein
MVLVQDPELARFDGMPRAAVATGLIDFVLSVKEMPGKLVSISTHPYVASSGENLPLLLEEDRLTRIFAVLREHTRVDFTLYKPSTIVRRIQRRMTVNQIHELAEYIELMESRRSEVMALYRELLIGVTSFYRDHEMWAELAGKHLSRVFRNEDSKELRMWVAGCSTGEEAYTLAMVCHDWMENFGVQFDIKIFATDIDRDAIARAGAGIYPESVTADLDPRLVTKFFSRHGEQVKVVRSVREMVVFAQHNLLVDPPFTNLDLVSCRNLLIYLQPVLQQKVIEAFNFSLNADGLLVLGTSETTGDMSSHFDCLNPKLKIYRSRGRVQKSMSAELQRQVTRPGRQPGGFMGTRHLVGVREEERVSDRLLSTLAKGHLPLSVVVNEHHEILHLLGDSQGYLKFPTGKVLNDISRLVVDDLAIPLATGLRKVFNSGKELKYANIRVNREKQSSLVNLSMRLLEGRKNQEPLAVIFIEEVVDQGQADSPVQTPDFDVTEATEQRINDLEQELQFNRENLQATIEELETSNEELQATNEELLASNEELQSTNEELQSVNEELHTVNTEYQHKIMELTMLHNDFTNLMAGSSIFTLFLDENLHIRKFTPDINFIFPLIDGGIGRSLKNLKHRLVDVDPLEIVHEVERAGEMREVEVRSERGDWFLLRVMPYRVAEDIHAGVVLTLVDITRLKEAQRELATTENRFAQLFSTLEEGVVYQDLNGRILDANPAAQKILGLSLDQMLGRTSTHPDWRAIRQDGTDFPGDEHPAMLSLKTGQPVKDKVMGVYNPSHEVTTWIKVSSTPLREDGGTEITGVYSRFVPQGFAGKPGKGDGDHGRALS